MPLPNDKAGRDYVYYVPRLESSTKPRGKIYFVIQASLQLHSSSVLCLLLQQSNLALQAAHLAQPVLAYSTFLTNCRPPQHQSLGTAPNPEERLSVRQFEWAQARFPRSERQKEEFRKTYCHFAIHRHMCPCLQGLLFAASLACQHTELILHLHSTMLSLSTTPGWPPNSPTALEELCFPLSPAHISKIYALTASAPEVPDALEERRSKRAGKADAAKASES